MVFDGAFGQHQARGDFAVAEPVGQQAQHVDLALAEQLVFGCGWRVAAREFGDQAGGDAGLNDAFTSMDLADCGQQFVGGRVFQQVATRPGLDAVEHILIVVEGRQDNDSCGGQLRDNLSSRGDAIAARHLHIHQHNVGAQRERALTGFLPIGRLADDGEAIF